MPEHFFCSSGFQSHKNPTESTVASYNFILNMVFTCWKKRVTVSPFEKLHKHAYIPIHKINCHHFSSAQNKTRTVHREHHIFLRQTWLMMLIQTTLQMPSAFLLVGPSLEYSQTQQWDLDGAHIWSTCNHLGVGTRERFMCLEVLSKRIWWC